MRGVAERERGPGREDLGPVAVALTPERRTPSGVEIFDGLVAVLEPAAERGRRLVAVAERVVAAQLVGDVPERDRRVVAIPIGDLLDQLAGVRAEDRRARAPGLPPARVATGPGAAADGRRRDPSLPGRAASHGGGEAVAVPRLTRMPFSCSSSTIASRFLKSYSPGRGSISDQPNTLIATRVIPASRMSATSSAHTSAGHCSGL